LYGGGAGWWAGGIWSNDASSVLENLTRSREGFCEDCTHLDSPATIFVGFRSVLSLILLSSKSLLSMGQHWLIAHVNVDFHFFRPFDSLFVSVLFVVDFVVILTAHELTAVSRTSTLVLAQMILTVRDITYTASDLY